MSRYNTFVHKNKLAQERQAKRESIKENMENRKLKKELRKWIKSENIEVPNHIKKMIGYLK